MGKVRAGNGKVFALLSRWAAYLPDGAKVEYFNDAVIVATSGQQFRLCRSSPCATKFPVRLEGQSFVNLNSPEDYQIALQLWKNR